MTEGKYVLGKNESVVNVVVPFSRIVGHFHCKICRIDDAFYVMDLDSSNETYLNKSESRLLLNRLYPLKDGNVLRLVNTFLGYASARGDEMSKIRMVIAESDYDYIILFKV